MSAAEDAWQAGRRAWERLAGWLRDDPGAGRGHVDSGDAAVDALDDIGVVRRLLDQAELVAVRTARRHGKSWAEIATRLGVSRQSAWERWRDVDDEHQGEREPIAEPATPAGPDFGVDVPQAVSEEILGRAAKRLRRRGNVVVPNVIGMRWDEARELLLGKGLIGISPDPDGPSLAAVGWPNAVVTDQSPESGAKVSVGSTVRLWLERGGGSAGVREPRRPKPTPGSGPEWRPEPADEAVS